MWGINLVSRGEGEMRAVGQVCRSIIVTFRDMLLEQCAYLMFMAEKQCSRLDIEHDLKNTEFHESMLFAVITSGWL
jgi:hypothetical protein